jgi:hypothetical protein
MLWTLDSFYEYQYKKYQYDNNIDASNWALQFMEFFHMHSQY